MNTVCVSVYLCIFKGGKPNLFYFDRSEIIHFNFFFIFLGSTLGFHQYRNH